MRLLSGLLALLAMCLQGCATWADFGARARGEVTSSQAKTMNAPECAGVPVRLCEQILAGKYGNKIDLSVRQQKQAQATSQGDQ